jgi:hypothetical protein
VIVEVLQQMTIFVFLGAMALKLRRLVFRSLVLKTRASVPGHSCLRMERVGMGNVSGDTQMEIFC